MLRIGLTGGIGSGKSTVAEMFARRGVPVIDTDAIARELSAPAGAGHAEIMRAFGASVLDASGNIDRARLRERVFRDAAARARLEAILHPRIRAEVERRVAGLAAEYCLLVIPLLFETDFIDLVDRVLVVDANEAEQIVRVQARSRLPRAEIEKIIAAQMGRAARAARAHDTIVNNADLAALEPQVESLHRRYRALAGAR